MAEAPAHMKSLTNSLQRLLENAAKASPDSVEKDVATIWEAGRTTIGLPTDPENMSRIRAIEILTAQEAAATQEFSVMERVPGMPLDAAAAFARVLKDRYGWLPAQTQQTFFGPKPPRMQMVKTGFNEEDYVEVPIGKFKLHDIEADIVTGFTEPGPDSTNKFMDFYISGTVNYQDRKVILDLVTATKKEIARASIYQGKALRLKVDEDGDLDAMISPEFLDLSKVDVNGLILNDDVKDLIQMCLHTPITNTAACIEHGIPLKRSILLEGPFGTGKTLTAKVTGAIGVKSGWTFVIVDNVTALADTLEFAKQFQPCVVFAEDIDRIVDHDRDEDANKILNTIDGLIGKDAKVITVLTTNNIEKLPPVMLRHGRLDAIVPVHKPDEKAVIQLVHYYAGSLLRDKDLTGLEELLVGMLPATIREVVERSKLGMLMHRRDHITLGDLRASALGLKAHAALLEKKQDAQTIEQQFGETFKRLFRSDVNGAGPLDSLTPMESTLNKVEDIVRDIRSRM